MKSKTIFLFLMCSLLLVSFASAGITDSVKYAPNELGVEDMKVELKSWWGFFEWLGINQTIGEFELKSHKSVDEVKQVIASWDVNMYYDFNFKELYRDGLGEVIFIDMKTGKKVQRDYKFVYEFKEDKTREVCLEYEQILNSTKDNQTYSQGDCINSETETYTETSWRDYNSLDIPKGIIRIGVEVNNRNNDYLDGIWIVGGKEITRHAPWNASLETGMNVWYKLDETSGTNVIDAHKNSNGTNNGILINKDGKINRAYEIDTTTDTLTYTISNSVNRGVFLWFKTTSTTANAIWHDGDYGNWGKRMNLGANGKLRVDMYSGSTFMCGGNGAFLSDNSINDGNWHYIGMVFDGTNCIMYVDGVNKNVSAGASSTRTGGNPIIGASADVSALFTFDEFVDFGRVVTQTEVTLLLNEEDGCTYQNCGELPLTINLTSPANNSFLTTNDVNFIGQVITEANMTNVSLVINNTIEQTNTSQVNGTYTFTETLTDGTYQWRIEGTTTENISASSSNYTLTIDSTDPTLTASVNNTILYKAGEPILLNTTATDTNLDKVWYSYNGTNTTITGASSGVLNQTTITTTFSALQIIVYANDTAGNTATPVTLTLSVDPTAPTITLAYPTSLIDYGRLNGSLQLNFTATDSNLDKVWYNYNGTNITIVGATSGIYNQSNITLSTSKILDICANDTAGNENCTSFSWDYRYFENNVSFNTPVLATSSQTFKLIGEKHSSVTGLTGRLFYDGTPRASTIVTSGNNINLTNNFEIPAGTATRNFFWEITTTTANGTFVFNTSSNTQTVQNITFNICSVATGLAYNFTTYDTETNLPLNSTFEATFSYYASGGTGAVLAEYNYQNLTENRSNYLFCLNSSGENVTIDAFISYGATGYDNRDYIIEDGTIGNFTVTIPLFLTQTLLTDIVTFTVEDQNYDRVAGALVTVQKWNVGTNTYSTIGMFTTSSSGTGIMNLELYNTWYRAMVTIDSVIVHVTDIQKLGSTDWPITVDLGVQNPYDLFGTISQGLDYDNETQIVTYSWSDSSGYVNTACMTVREPTGSGFTTLYNDCVDSVAGSINYQFTENGTYEVYGTVYLTAEYDGISQVGDYMSIMIGVPEIAEISSPYGKVISFVIVGTGGLAGVSLGSPIFGIVLIIAGLFGVSWMGWLKGIEAIMWSIVTIAIIILARQSRRGS